MLLKRFFFIPFAVVVFCISLELGARINAKATHQLNEYEDLIEQQGFSPTNKQPGEKRIFLIGESAVP